MSNQIHDKRKKCFSCDTPLSDDEFTHKISYGSWNIRYNSFRREPQEEYYCRECWSDKKPHNEGIKFHVKTTDMLFDTLDSANGEIAVDFGQHTIGSTGIATVVDSNIYFCVSKFRKLSGDFISTYFTYKKMERDDFDESVSELIESDLPSVVYLRNIDKTPFSEYNFPEDEQYRIDKFTD